MRETQEHPSPKPQGQSPERDERRKRHKSALRENLLRRKQAGAARDADAEGDEA